MKRTFPYIQDPIQLLSNQIFERHIENWKHSVSMLPSERRLVEYMYTTFIDRFDFSTPEKIDHVLPHNSGCA
jgi:hypothetical protein